MYLIDYIEDYFAAEQAARNSASASFHTLAKRLATYMDKQGLRLEVSDLTPQLVADYSQWLQSLGYKASTWSYYMRNLRVVARRAHEEGRLAEAIDFKAYDLKTEFRDEQREVEVLTAEQLTVLQSLPDTTAPRLLWARDLFLLGLYLNGMTDTQLVRLTKDDLTDNRMAYQSLLTGQRAWFRLQPEAMDLIQRYKATPESPYLLNLIREEDGPTGTAERKALARMRMATVKLQKAVGFPVRASMARTTWLKWALELRIDSLTICDAMQMEVDTFMQFARTLRSAQVVSNEVDLAHRLVVRH